MENNETQLLTHADKNFFISFQFISVFPNKLCEILAWLLNIQAFLLLYLITGTLFLIILATVQILW